MSPGDERLIKQAEARKDDPVAYKLAQRLRVYIKLDNEAATHVESAIAMRTHFTGDPPYVGWEGLGLALKEALDQRDRMRASLEELHRLIDFEEPFAGVAIFEDVGPINRACKQALAAMANPGPLSSGK